MYFSAKDKFPILAVNLHKILKYAKVIITR